MGIRVRAEKHSLNDLKLYVPLLIQISTNIKHLYIVENKDIMEVILFIPNSFM